MTPPALKAFGKTFLYSVWLPITVIILTALRFGILQEWQGFGAFNILEFVVQIAMLFLFAWPSGIPLTLAIQKLHRRARNTSFFLAIIFVPLSAYAVIIGGLFGPIGMFAYAAVASVPTWMILGIVTAFQRHRSSSA